MASMGLGQITYVGLVVSLRARVPFGAETFFEAPGFDAFPFWGFGFGSCSKNLLSEW